MNQFRIAAILSAIQMKAESRGWEPYYTTSFTFQRKEIRFSLNLRMPYEHPRSNDWDSANNYTIEEHTGYDDFELMIARINARVAEIPTLENHLRGLWRQKLADLTEEGEILGGFAMEYTEMLKATAKALAENALPAPAPVFDDEIPF